MEVINKLFQLIPTTISNYLEDFAIEVIKQGKLPDHVAFIMDGNRRYAKIKGIATKQGHTIGFHSLEKILDACLKLGIKAVTAYAFSIDNFKRSKEEVDALMNLAKTKLEFLCTQSDLIKKHQVSIRVIGRLSLLPPDVLNVINKAVKETSHYKNAILTICFPYTSTDELCHVVQRHLEPIINESSETKSIDKLDNNRVESLLYTSDLPKLDLMIRTSGEIRLSDFLIWQTSIHQAQIYFLPVLWPTFSIWHLLPILLQYQIYCNDHYDKTSNLKNIQDDNNRINNSI